jgi:hypothetical protein
MMNTNYRKRYNFSDLVRDALHPHLPSSVQADNPVRRDGREDGTAAAYWMPRMRGA